MGIAPRWNVGVKPSTSFRGNHKRHSICAMAFITEGDRASEILRVLGKKKITTAAGKAGRATQYVRLLDFEVGDLEVDSAVPTLVPVVAAPSRHGVQEEKVRAVLKAWNPTAEIVAFTPFLYPLYRIRFETRSVCLDAVTGNAVKESP